MQRVFVLGSDKKPLDPCHPARARKLLTQKRAAVFKYYPFTIIMKDVKVEDAQSNGYRIKIDPGSKVTGIAVVGERNNTVVWAAELQHRGQYIVNALLRRRMLRRNRRFRKTRYRPARFLNRRKLKGWLPQSQESRIANVKTWVERLRKSCPVTALSMELTKFDTQKMDKPEISGIEYQQGELQGYEVREYLLEKWAGSVLTVVSQASRLR